MKTETDVEALVDALTDAIRDPPTGEGATWMNEYQARACPRCAGDTRARHIYPTCARTALLAAIRDREERARREGHEEAAAIVVRWRAFRGALDAAGLDMDRIEDEIRALSERGEG